MKSEIAPHMTRLLLMCPCKILMGADCALYCCQDSPQANLKASHNKKAEQAVAVGMAVWGL